MTAGSAALSWDLRNPVDQVLLQPFRGSSNFIAYFGLVFIGALFVWVLRSLVLHRRVRSLQFFTAHGLCTKLSNSFPSVTIPLDYFVSLTVKQLNALLHASTPVPPVTTPVAIVPCHIKKTSLSIIPAASGKSGLFDVSMEVDVTASCTISLSVNVPRALIVEAMTTPSSGIQPVESVASQNVQHPPNSARHRQKLLFADVALDDAAAATIPLVIVIRATASSVPCLMTSAIARFDLAGWEHWTLVYGQVRHAQARDVTIDNADDTGVADVDPRSPVSEDAATTDGGLEPRTPITVRAEPDIDGHASAGQNKSEDFSVQHVYQCVHTGSVDSNSGLAGVSTAAWYSLDEIYGPTSSIHSLDRVEVSDDDQPQCVVCLSDMAQLFILPCRHLCLCMDCWAGGNSGGGTTGNDSAGAVETVDSDNYDGSDNELELHSVDDNSTSPASQRVQTQWTACPVCRGPVNSWIEMHKAPQTSPQRRQPDKVDTARRGIISGTAELRSPATVAS